MIKIKENSQIGNYLKKKILSKFRSCRQFCIEYIILRDGISKNELDFDDVRKLTNRLSQILKGIKSIQTYDLPLFSHLLGVSCEEILSAGSICVPIMNRMTNYYIAFSKNKNDWIEYINREDCIAYYADEFGKTVVDYALEFKNYKFLKFLMDNGYIQFVSSDLGYYQEYNFGAKTSLSGRNCVPKTIESEIYEEKLFRTKMIALAIENNDISVLDELRARELPPQLSMTVFNCRMVKFDDYYDDDYIDCIANSKDEVFNYFLEEYQLKDQSGRNEITWLYPFFGKLIKKTINLNLKRSITLLDIAIKHNESALMNLKQCILRTVKELKSIYKNSSVKDIVESIVNDLQFNEEKTVYCFHQRYKYDIWSATNIICVNALATEAEVQSKIDQLNELYNKIINIKDYLYKQNSALLLEKR